MAMTYQMTAVVHDWRRGKWHSMSDVAQDRPMGETNDYDQDAGGQASSYNSSTRMKVSDKKLTISHRLVWRRNDSVDSGNDANNASVNKSDNETIFEGVLVPPVPC